MEITQAINHVGINTDRDKRFLKEGEYTYALNALYTNKPFLVNDFANEFCIDLEANVIGSVYVDNYIHIVLLDDNSIMKLNLELCTKELVYQNDCLNFDTCNWVKVRHTRLNDCGKSVLYFTDGVNATKFITLDDNTLNLTCEELLLNPCGIIPKYVSHTVNDFGGNIDSGIYQFAISYNSDNNVKTNWYILTDEIYVYEDKFRNNLFENIDGNVYVENINKSISIFLDNLNTNYETINIAVIKKSTTATVSKIVYSGVYGSSFSYTFTGYSTNDITIAIDEIAINSGSFFTANDLEFKDNRLLLAGIKGIKNINYQKYANNIKVTYFTKKIKLDTAPMVYKNPDQIHKNRSWLRDEIYSLGIVWDFCDGTSSNAFPLIGRKADCFEDYTGSNVDVEGLEYCDNLILEEDENIIDCDLEKWKNRNTAVRTYYDDCPVDLGNIVIGRIYQEIIFCKKRYTRDCTTNELTLIEDECQEDCQFPLNLFDPYLGAEYCTELCPDTLIPICLSLPYVTHKLYVYTTCDTDLTADGYEIETECTNNLIKWKKCHDPLNPAPIDYKDECESPVVVSCIHSKGELAYWESCEKYPDYKDCEGNTMFPHTIDEDGNIIMDNIRLFKMPDNIVEPCYDCLNDNFVERQAYSIGTVDTRRPYDDCYVYPLGLEFKDIAIPDDIDRNLVKGYRIVYIERNGSNKSVLGKGILHGCYRNSGRDDKLWAVPKHGVNSKIYFNADLNGFETHLGKNGRHVGAYTFMSPNLLLSSPALFGDYIHIEQEYYGKGESYGERENIDNGDCDNVGRRQNININSHRNSKRWNSDRLQVNRKLKGIMYAPANTPVTLSNSDFTFPLWNVYRESSTYIELKTSSSDYLQLSGDDVAWEDPLSYCTDNEITDTYFGNTVNIHDCDNSLTDDEEDDRIIDKAAAWYISVKRNICDLYGDITSQVYVDTGLTEVINNTDSVFETSGCYGDSYINYWSYRRTSNIHVRDTGEALPVSNTTGYIDPNDQNGTNPLFDYCGPMTGVVVKTLVHSIVESDYNVDLRHGGSGENEWYYPNLNNHQLNLDSGVPNTADSSNSYLNRFYYLDSTGDCDRPDGLQDFSDNYWQINPDYALTSKLKAYVPINNSYKTCDCNKDLPNRILYSEVSNLSNYNYNIFRSENYIDVPYQHGFITNIVVLNNKLYAHTTDIIWQIFTNEKQLQLSDETIYLGTGDLFSQLPYPIYANQLGYGGNKYQHGTLLTELGYFWYDVYGGKIHWLNDKIDNLSDIGLQYFFKNNSKFCNEGSCDSPIIMANDYYNNRVLITKKDGDKSFTLSYSFNSKSWISFHSFIPDYYLYDRNNFYTMKDKLLYRHNVQCKYNNYYDKIEPYIIELVLVVAKSNYSNVFESIQFNCETYKCSGDNCDIIYVDKETFNKILAYNSNQTTGIMDLIFSKGYYLRTEPAYPGTILDKSRRHFSINKLRDYTNETSYGNLPMFISEGECNCEIDKKFNEAYINPNKYHMQLQKLKDKYIVIRLILDNKDDIQLFTDTVLTINNDITR